MGIILQDEILFSLDIQSIKNSARFIYIYIFNITITFTLLYVKKETTIGVVHPGKCCMCKSCQGGGGA